MLLPKKTTRPLMRALVVLVAGLLVVTVVPLGGSQQVPQETAGELQVLDDTNGDVLIVPEDGGSQSDGGNFPQADLLGAWVDETPEFLIFKVQVAELAESSAHVQVLDDLFVYVHFVSHDQEYRIQMDVKKNEAGELRRNAFFEKLNGAGEYDYVTKREIILDSGSGTLTTWVDRTLIPDSKGAPPFPERSIKDFWVESFGLLRPGAVLHVGEDAYGAPIYVTDRMPDEGVSIAKWDIQFGLEQLGHVSLKSDDPIRTSNGEASTFVFPVVAVNKGDKKDVFDLVAKDVPNGWTVTFPRPSVVVDGQGEARTAVLLTTPFEHNHGEITTFLVEGQSRDDPSAKGKVELGLRYTETPQPAGHHDILWIYSVPEYDPPLQDFMGTVLAGNDGQVFFNAKEGYDPDGQPEVPVRGIPNWDSPGPDAGSQTWWRIKLKPELGMGLDFDLTSPNNQGSLDIPIQSETPLGEATLAGQLIHRASPSPDAEETVIVDLESQSKELAPGTKETFTFTFSANPEADLLPYSQGALLYWDLTLTHRNTAPGTGADLPAIMPGGWMRLPLFEYQDPVDDLYATLENIKLVSNDGQERFVNPGATAIFQVSVENGQEKADTFRIDVYGSERGWATLPLGNEVSVDAGATNTFPLVLQVPEDAPDARTADLIIEAVSKSDDNVRALVRILAIVDTDQEWPDDAADAQALSKPKKESPGVPLVAATAALAALAVALRRRR